MALISVITPTYNRSELLPQLYDCLHKQIFTNWELVIVDDGSTDATEVVALSLTNDTRVKFIRKNNSGAAHSRNVGANIATGDYLIFLDSDDLVREDWLLKITNKVQEKLSDIVCVGVQFENLDGSIKEELPNSHSSLFPGAHFQLYAGAFAISKNLFFKIGAYDTTLKARQHTDLWIRIFSYLQEKHLEIDCIYEPLVRIIEHKGERIRKNPKAVYSAAIDLINKHKDTFYTRKKALFDYYVLIGTNALGAKETAIGMSYLAKAFTLYPLNLKNNLRLIASLFSLIGINSWEKKFK